MTSCNKEFKNSTFFSDIKNKKIAFIGISRSHFDLIKLFKKNKLNVIACDKRTKQELGDKVKELEDLNILLKLGPSYLDNLNVDVIFRTPGMNFFNEKLTFARKNGIVVTSEMEVFFDLCPCKIVAVTGSDGKTTTTTILSEILKKTGKKIHVGGNIGRPLLPIIEKISSEDIVVVELSSFQLISMRKSPDISVVTNISANHLDVHKDMSEYIDAKKNILLHQNAFSKSILNYDNEITKEFEKYCRGKVLFFSNKEKVNNGTYVDEDGSIYFTVNGDKEFIINKNEIKIPGTHNLENYLAAISAVYKEFSVTAENIHDVAKSFNGVEHRMEFIRELDGVKFYNDSIASTPTRTVRGTLSTYDRKIILICGGYDKKIPFDVLSPAIMEKVKVLVLMGQTASKLENTIKSFRLYDKNTLKIIRVNNMTEAVLAAKENASKGDIISLSPACASFDMYKDFTERGNHFKNIVLNLK